MEERNLDRERPDDVDPGPASPIDMNDRELVQRCLAGDAAGWETLMQRMRPCLEAAIGGTLRRCGVPDASALSDDLLQETFVALFGNDGAVLRRFQWSCPLDRYLMSIAVHRTIDWIRCYRRMPSLDDPRVAAALLEGSGPEIPARQEQVRGAMERLPPRERLALRLVYWRALPVAAAARILGIRPESLSVSLSRARRKLAAHLKSNALRCI